MFLPRSLCSTSHRAEPWPTGKLISPASEEGGKPPLTRQRPTLAHLQSQGLFLSSPGLVSLFRQPWGLQPHSRVFRHCSAVPTRCHSHLEEKLISLILEMKPAGLSGGAHHWPPCASVSLICNPSPGCNLCPSASRGSRCQGTTACLQPCQGGSPLRALFP